MGDNIPAPTNGEKFVTDVYMASLGRHPPRIISKASLLQLPRPQLQSAVFSNWQFESQDSAGYPHVPQVKWQIGVNHLQNKAAQYGNSFYSAIAMLIYGDAELWFWVKAQHLAFFEQVLNNNTHPRNRLYKFINSANATGPNQFTLLSRLSIPDCYVDHSQIKQVTADLYGIFLVVFTYQRAKPGAAERFRGVYASGSFNARHMFIRRTEKYEYQPMIPSGVPRPSEFRFPSITFDSTVGDVGLTAPGLVKSANDGGLHPWRRLNLNTPVPPELVPIAALPQELDRSLEIVLWVKFQDPMPPAPITINAMGLIMDPSTQTGGTAGLGEKSTTKKEPSNIFENPTTGGENVGIGRKIETADDMADYLDDDWDDLRMPVLPTRRTDDGEDDEDDDEDDGQGDDEGDDEEDGEGDDEEDIEDDGEGDDEEDGEGDNEEDIEGNLDIEPEEELKEEPEEELEEEPEEELEEVPEEKSPPAPDYNNWSAAALKQECRTKEPAIPFKSKWKAAYVRRKLIPLLVARDDAERTAREAIRAGKRKRAAEREQAQKKKKKNKKSEGSRIVGDTNGQDGDEDGNEDEDDEDDDGEEGEEGEEG